MISRLRSRGPTRGNWLARGTEAARIGGNPGRSYPAMVPAVQRERLPLSFRVALALLAELFGAAFALRSA